jgi:arylsulfatase A-like enzyme/SAM-dependent methyltransferase
VRDGGGRDGYSLAAVEERTRTWLQGAAEHLVREAGYILDPARRIYDADGNPQHLTQYHFQTVLRKLKVFRWLDRFRFESFIDVASGWDHYPHLVEARYGVRALSSDFVHAVNLPHDGTGGKLDRAVTLNASRLPFPDDAFDAVLCSEVIEHLVRPVEVIAELLRITRRYLIVTSLEALSVNRLQRWWSHRRVDVRVPHVERNFLLAHEFEAIFGPDVHHENLFHGAALPVSPFAPDDVQARAYAAIRTAADFEAHLVRALAIADHRPGAMGILLVKRKGDAPIAPARPESDAALARWLVAETAVLEREAGELLVRIRDGRAALVARERPVAAALRERLRCPDCRGTLDAAGTGVRCAACGAAFPGEYGVPILYPTRSPEPDAAEAACLDRLCGADTARRRVVRRVMHRLRRAERPPGALRRALWRALPATLGGLVLALAVGCGDAPVPRNVLLVSIDSLRADRVGAWGNPRAVSPTIDRLAAEGVRFARASSPTSWTLPAHVSLLTGLALRHHGTIQVDDRIDDAITRLPEVFADHGWETVGFYSGPLLDPAYGFARGFASYVDCESPETAAHRGILADEASHADRTNGRVAEAFEAWLGRHGTRPFFAFVHFWDVHYDYIPPEPYASMFDPGYTGRLDGRDILGAGFPLRASRRDVEHLLALYDGELRWTDDTLGRLLGMLAARGLLDDTLVVVAADHGDEFLEHGGKGHQTTLFEELVHVPLVLWAHAALPHGRRIDTPVSLVDVAPTILDVMHLPALPRTDGRSLVPLVRGEAAPPPPVVGALHNMITGALQYVSVRQGDVKLVYDAGAARWRRYDLARDPGEHAPGTPAPDEPLLAVADGELAAVNQALARRHDGGRPRNEEALPAALVERLRSLGYVQ